MISLFQEELEAMVALAVLMPIVASMGGNAGTQSMTVAVRALAAVIAMAMMQTLAAAAFAGIVLPLALERMGVDPALASGPFVTTVTDVVGFFTFLGLASLVLL